MPPTSNTERLLSLALTLFSTQRGLSRDELMSLVPGYTGESAETRRRQFSRDIARLDKLGLDIRISEDPLQSGVNRYRIVESAGAEHTFHAGAREQAVLAAASAMWNTRGACGLGARVRAKLASHGISADSAALQGPLGDSPALGPLLEAQVNARAVTFKYRSSPAHQAKDRTVEPWAIGTGSGRAYVYGYDRGREAPRLFRVSRIVSAPRDVGPAKHERGSDASIAQALGSALHPLTSSGGGEIIVHAEPYKALVMRHLSGVEADVDTFTVAPEHAQAVLTRALQEPMWVRLSGDNPVVEELADIRSRIAAAHTAAPDIDPKDIENLRRADTPRARFVTNSDDEFTRLSAEVAYVYEHGSVDMQEMAEHFGISASQLEQDLRTLYTSGDYSHGIDELVDAQWEDGLITITGADALARPLTISPSEASALLLGLEVLEDMHTPLPDDAVMNVKTLLTGILGAEKLRTSPLVDNADAAQSASAFTNDLGAGAQERLHLAPSPEMLRAMEQARPRRIMYSQPARKGVSIRDIIPTGWISMYGTAYIEASCLTSEATREFRADRIVAEWDPEDPLAPPTGDTSQASALSRLPAGKVLVSCSEQATWVLEAFQAEDIRVSADGRRCVAWVHTPATHALIAAIFEARGHASVLAPAAVRDALASIAGQAHFDQ